MENDLLRFTQRLSLAHYALDRMHASYDELHAERLELYPLVLVPLHSGCDWLRAV